MLQLKKTNIDIEEYYTRYGPMVLRRCRQLLRDEDRALDAMQDVFTKVLMRKESLKDAFPSSFLFRIATNVCLNMIRDRKSHLDINKEDVMTQIALTDESENRMIVQNTLDRIFNKEKKSTREIAVLHFVDGMTLKEVASEVGLSLSGVRKRINNLRTRIQVEREVRYEN
ncbi:RNA polymerase sigma factor [Acidobacteriota bacterium]